MKVTIKTDQEISGLSFNLAFDGPFTKAEISTSYTTSIGVATRLGDMNGHPAFGFSLTYPNLLLPAVNSTLQSLPINL
jgi:hypothetical protein